MKKLFLYAFLCCGYFGYFQLNEVDSGAYRWNELPIKEGNQRMGRKILEGSEPHFSYLEIHATTQEKGAVPSKPHAQENKEELIIVKEGLLKVTIDGESKILPAGSIAVIPPLAEQSMENVGDGPVTYYVMIYTARKPMDIDRSNKAGGHLLIHSNDLAFKENQRGGRIDYFDRPTAMCQNFEMHVTHLNEKGPSHEPHSHFHSEIIVVIEGNVEMTIDGKSYLGTAGDLFLMKSNEAHGLSNIGEQPCRYYAFGWQ